MKKIFTCIMLAASLSAYSFTNVCEDIDVEGKYENLITLGDIEYAENMSFDEVLPHFSISLYLFSLSKKDDSTYAYKFNGLTEMGEMIVGMEGEKAKEEFLSSMSAMENLSFVVKKVNEKCSLVSSLDDNLLVTFVDEKSGAMFDLDTSEKLPYVSGMSKKILDVIVDDDPFDF